MEDATTTETKPKHKRLRNLTGLRYGRLVALERFGTTKHNNATWLCVCDCGELKIIASGNLRSGNSTSCGCERSKKSGERIGEIARKQLGPLNPFWGKTHREELRKQWSERNKKWLGPLSPRWRGGVTPINQRQRGGDSYKKWRESVFKRDDYTCQNCGLRGVYLESHHINAWATHPNLRFELSNGLTLCKDCHKLTDSYPGRAKIYV
jgi:hypothetical protein